MAKKKNSNARSDQRGYSHGENIPKPNARAATKQVKVSVKAHEGLVDLLDVLSVHSPEATAAVAPIIDKKRLLKKVTNLHDDLEELGFKEDAIQDVIQSLGNSDRLNIEAALDWLCLNVETERLPALFTEGLVRDEAVTFVTDSNNFTIITAQPKNSQEKELEHAHGVQDNVPHIEYSKKEEKKEDSNEDVKAAQKAWLIQQYQYEQEDEDDDEKRRDETSTEVVQGAEQETARMPEEIRLVELEKQLQEDESDLNDDGANYLRSKHEIKALQNKVKNTRKRAQGLRNKVAQMKAKVQKEEFDAADDADDADEEGGGSVSIFANLKNNEVHPTSILLPDEHIITRQDKEEETTRLPEEIRLEELEKQLQEDEKDTNDETANYMRSKHEIKELQVGLKKSRKMVHGLRNKVAQLQANKQKPEEKGETNDGADASEGDAIFNLFSESTDQLSLQISDTAPDKSDAAVKVDTISADNLPLKPKNERGLNSSALSIPKNWTGKTPKKILEEWCQKRKRPKALYQKLPRNTMHGCRIVVKKDPKRAPLTIEQEGPFASFLDAQEYLATEALYALEPTLPLYRLFPPVFRDLWRSWVDREKEEKEEQAQKRRDAKKSKMNHLVGSIPIASQLPKQKVLVLKDNSFEETGVIKKASEEVLDSWEDDSAGEEKIFEQKGMAIAKPSALGNKLRLEFAARQDSRKYQEMLKSRKALPMYDYRLELLNTVHENGVTILCAETGAGKTTQAGQFILEEALQEGKSDQLSIICTQPRRVAAISVAERVSEEMGEESVGGRIGYHIRMETKRSSRTQLLFCTTGVVLRKLQDDPNLTGVTHVLVDEVHERQWQIDFLLIALRKLINTTRRDLKIILMSATLDAKLFCSFFHGAPLLSVPGRTFPVSQYFLEDVMDATDHIIEEGSRYAIREQRTHGNTASLWVTTKGGEKQKQVVTLESESQVSEVSDLYPDYKMSTRRSMDRVDEQVINYDLILDVLSLLLIKPENNDILLPPDGIDVTSISNGAVLVFLPGLGEIRSLTDRLTGSRLFGDRRKFEIIPLHSTLSPKDQRRAFLKPKHGCQKIILSTNIAETSVTIPDVLCVIDTGLVREVRQNKKSFTSTLVADWCSRASAKQRAGRAGRVQPGICCKLYSSRTAKQIMKEQATPELQRVPLEEVCLSILAGGLANNCMEFLQQAPQPPLEESVFAALKLLQELGAIDPFDSSISSPCAKAEHLTPLGQHLAKLPVNVRLGKMLIFGALFCCLDKTLTVAASLSCKSPFSSYVRDTQQAEAKHKAFVHQTSDFFTVCNVWESYRTELAKGSFRARKFCDHNYLNHTTLLEIKDMRDQFLSLLTQIGFVTRQKSGVDTAASLYNTNGSKESVVSAVICAGLYPNVAHALATPGDGLPTLWHGKESVHFHSSSVNSKNKNNVPSEWIAFYEKFATHRTYVSATSYIHPFALLLFGGSLAVRHTERKVLVDDWIELKIAAQTGVLFRELRGQMDSLLKDMIKKVNASHDEKNQALLDGIVKLLASTDMAT